ncbi:MAG TPA: thiamine phosphate synthase [Vicinamibacterales bacterium]
MRLPGLYAVLDDEVARREGWGLAPLAGVLFAEGVRFVQIRAKTLPSGDLLRQVEAVLRAGEPYDAIVVVNDRPDVACIAGAAGVHVGQDDLPPSAARRIVGDAALVGVSTHTPAQIAAAAGEPVTYIAIGPVFGTRTKDTGYDPVGPEMVARAAEAGRPVVAIGGITLDRAPAVFAAGATSVAVITDLFTGGDPAARARAWLARLRDAGAGL